VILQLKLLFKNAFRRKFRAFLTILSVTVALLAFGLLQTFIDAWYAGAEASSARRLVCRNSISLTFPLPLAYRDKIRQIEGVEAITYGSWFGGIYIEEKNFFANFAIEPHGYFRLYDYKIPAEQKERFLRDRRSAVAGRRLVERFGWRIGDIITLRGTIFPGNWEFVLAGIYSRGTVDLDESQFFFHWDYLNQALKKIMPHRADMVDFYIIGVSRADLTTEVAQAIDQTFKNSLAETLTETERSFQLSFVTMSEAIIKAIQLISLVVILIIMAVAANTMAMSVRERTGEWAVLKTLGFGPRKIIVLILAESLIIALAGCIIATALTFPMVSTFGRTLRNYLPIFRLKREIFYFYLAASFLVGVVAAIIPACRAARVPIAEALRRIA